MNYSELLKSPLWQRKRLEIFDRDNWTCRFCSDTTRQLHVHLTIYIYDKLPWEYPDEYLLTLCDSCHLDEEKLKSEDKFLLGNLIISGISRRQLFSLASCLRGYFAVNDKNKKFIDLTEYLYE